MQLQFLDGSHKSGIAHSLWYLPAGISKLLCVEEGDMLQSRASLLHHQRDRARRLPSPRADCRGVKLSVQPGVSRVVLQEGSLHPRGLWARGRDSATRLGQRSVCPWTSPWRRGEKLWVEGVTLSRAAKDPCAVEMVLCGSQLLTGPDYPRTLPRGLFKKDIKARATWKKSCFPGSLLSVPCCGCGGNANGAVKFAQEIGTPTALH